VLLVIAYSRAARQSLRNVVRAHEDAVHHHFGRVALFAETEFGAFQVLRLQHKHGEAIQLAETEPFNEFATVPAAVRDAAATYEARETDAVPYASFAASEDLPNPDSMRGSPLGETDVPDS
jgi:hypothetical protein